ncbi:hypothetical protein BKA65DRAFT_477175 [Rhexocercosporidium sp. MPI-PUGE-AT-0058]|nr:hypothetical protein BKA65DRAFT_477175 [Rhexocercosporidium sp. MPI-PUGE-AT-0058]
MHSVPSTIASCCANPASDKTTSLENDTTTASDRSRDATSEGVIAYATREDNRHVNHGEYQLPNATWTSQSFESFDRVDEPGRQVPLALTQQALQQHNTKNITADGRTTNKHPFDKYHMDPISLDDTVVYASILDEHVCPKGHVEPYSYPRRWSKCHLSIARVEVDNQSFDADIRLLFPSVGYQEVHPYPTCINEVDLYDHSLESEFSNVPSNTKPSFFFSAPTEASPQGLDQWSNAYAGIGTQFSS